MAAKGEVREREEKEDGGGRERTAVELISTSKLITV